MIVVKLLGFEGYKKTKQNWNVNSSSLPNTLFVSTANMTFPGTKKRGYLVTEAEAGLCDGVRI